MVVYGAECRSFGPSTEKTLGPPPGKKLHLDKQCIAFPLDILPQRRISLPLLCFALLFDTPQNLKMDEQQFVGLLESLMQRESITFFRPLHLEAD